MKCGGSNDSGLVVPLERCVELSGRRLWAAGVVVAYGRLLRRVGCVGGVEALFVLVLVGGALGPLRVGWAVRLVG